MKFCTNCGSPVGEKERFCQNCGSQLPVEEKTVPAAAVAQQPQQSWSQPDPWTPQQNSAFRAPVGQLATNRGLLKYILLSIITFGIYGIVVMSNVSTDINTIASRYDGKKTMHYCLVVFVFSWLTFGIVPLVWMHRISARIGGELYRRGIDYPFGAGSFWGWGVLGAFILVGPFIYYYKLFKSMNLLSEHYNVNG